MKKPWPPHRVPMLHSLWSESLVQRGDRSIKIVLTYVPGTGKGLGIPIAWKCTALHHSARPFGWGGADAA